jgi:hypothetical protein
MILVTFRHGLRASEVCRPLRALRKLKREEIESRFAFMTERAAPITTAGYRKMIARTGESAKLPFPVHPHMLRHACGYKLANDGQDTRALQHYLGHRNIQHTCSIHRRAGVDRPGHLVYKAAMESLDFRANFDRLNKGLALREVASRSRLRRVPDTRQTKEQEAIGVQSQSES